MRLKEGNKMNLLPKNPWGLQTSEKSSAQINFLFANCAPFSQSVKMDSISKSELQYKLQHMYSVKIDLQFKESLKAFAISSSFLYSQNLWKYSMGFSSMAILNAWVSTLKGVSNELSIKSILKSCIQNSLETIIIVIFWKEAGIAQYLKYFSNKKGQN